MITISTIAFKSVLRQERSARRVQITSIYKIDKVIADRKAEDFLEEENEELRQRALELIPPEYHDLLRTFSKVDSDTLPPHRLHVDHKIEFIGGKTAADLGYSPLYKMSLDELEADRYPLPLIEETLSRIAKAKIFTKIDRYINNTLFDYLDDFCSAYVDDILIYSDNLEEHRTHVKKVLQRLRDAGLQADLKKSEFHVTETKFLGYIINTEGIRANPKKLTVVKFWESPITVKGDFDFNVGDYVLILKKQQSWKTDRPSDKLDYPMVQKKFKILEREDNTFVLDVPPTWRASNRFHVDRLRKYPNNPLEGQEADNPDGEIVEPEGDEEFEVEKYPAENFRNSAKQLKEFHDDNPDLAGPPARLEEWLEAAAEDRFAEPHPDDNRALAQGRRQMRRRHA
ncbi:hypothetical protein NUW58_g2405 [Xylaria curta]|uniref:Uncharacterized protein n=1 Tax=Xylaria curta TaxID=42375 RepID=A0ACC1PFR1_9PEZI|nr:hypothetical protein NUW58_g2405 [Xylaria curta]